MGFGELELCLPSPRFGRGAGGEGENQGYFILKCDVFKVPLPDLGEGFRVRAKTTVLNLNRV